MSYTHSLFETVRKFLVEIFNFRYEKMARLVDL
jgi:hypothetical protein